MGDANFLNQQQPCLRLVGTPKAINGTVHLPASKSISNRLLVLQALAPQQVSIENLSDARDTQVLKSLLERVGCWTDPPTGACFEPYQPYHQLDVGDAGTAMRFLTAFAACSAHRFILTGSPRMLQRPVGELVEALRELGASVFYTGQKGCPPLMIEGRMLKGGRVSIDASVSSQFVSALLLVAARFDQGLELHLRAHVASYNYIKMTLGLLEEFGVLWDWDKNIIRIQPRVIFSKKTVVVEADWSSASYFYALLALAEEGELLLPGLQNKSLQGDAVCEQIFAQWGVKTEFTRQGVRLSKSQHSSLPEFFEYNFSACPDLAQTLAVVCAAKGVPARLTGLESLPLKETDRLNALRQELEKMAIPVRVVQNSVLEMGSGKMQVVHPIATWNDHRMAMSFAPLALLHNPLQVMDPAVVEKSFPQFWQQWAALGFQMENA